MLYCGDRMVSEPVSIDGNGGYQLTCQILKENFQEEENQVTVKFYGDDNLADYEQTVMIRVTGDAYLPVEEIPASCETQGKKAHFVDRAGKLYIEENGQKKEVTEEQLVIPALGHSLKEAWIQIDGRHYQECLNGCGKHFNEADCSGGTATTTERAICAVCGNPYGELLEAPEKPEKPEVPEVNPEIPSEESIPVKQEQGKGAAKAAKTGDAAASLMWLLLLLGAGFTMNVVHSKRK